MSQNDQLQADLEMHRKAFAEVSFLLDAYAGTVTGLMGGATASVGRIAGRNMARKMPVYLPEASLEKTLVVLGEQMGNGFDLKSTVDDHGADISFGRCAIREICRVRNLAPGGDLCRLFHYYADGIVNEICLRPTKTSILETGETCRIRLEAK
jgi:hypothetical protein